MEVVVSDFLNPSQKQNPIKEVCRIRVKNCRNNVLFLV